MFRKLISYLGVLSPLHIQMVTLFSGAKRIGQDEFGNVYYACKARPGYKHDRRWVKYNGVPEASAIPPEWHGWIHHQTDVVPHPDAASFRRLWQVPHQPNRTGTNLAYRPPGHMLKDGKRDETTGDYEAWTPDSK